MLNLDTIKKCQWYPIAQQPPRRNERLGGLNLILWLDDKPQPGFYSHEEHIYYVICHQFKPQTKSQTEISTDINSINQDMIWEPIPTEEASHWMLIENPKSELI